MDALWFDHPWTWSSADTEGRSALPDGGMGPPALARAGGVRFATGSRHASAPISTTASVRRVRREVMREPSTV